MQSRERMRRWAYALMSMFAGTFVVLSTVILINYYANDLEDTIGPIRSTFVSSDNSENDDRDNFNTSGFETITPDDRATRAIAEYDFNLRNYDIELAQTIPVSTDVHARLRSSIGSPISTRFSALPISVVIFKPHFHPSRNPHLTVRDLSWVVS